MSNSFVDARLIVDLPASGSWNMAVDQALLDCCDSVPVLRFYRWSVPTLSLGYFQHHARRLSHSASIQAPLLRRSTGGGAIVHDQELTYSLQVPSGMVPSRSADLYDIIHESFCQWLTEQGVVAKPYCSDQIAAPESIDQKAFLCFQRRADGDVIGWTEEIDEVGKPFTSAGFKLLGSAQRKQKNALLQHGSILLRTSDCAPELLGVMDLESYRGPMNIEDAARQIEAHLQQTLSEKLHWQFEKTQITQAENRRATAWQHERFENPQWNLSR